MKYNATLSFEFAQSFTGYLCALISQTTNLLGYNLAEGNFFWG